MSIYIYTYIIVWSFLSGKTVLSSSHRSHRPASPSPSHCTARPPAAADLPPRKGPAPFRHRNRGSTVELNPLPTLEDYSSALAEW